VSGFTSHRKPINPVAELRWPRADQSECYNAASRGRFSEGDAAYAHGGKRNGALTPLRLVQVVHKDLDQFFQYLSI
jgi:hypothetical protein